MMSKYIITTVAKCEFQYEVEAESLGEAEDLFYAGSYKELNNGNPIDIRDEDVATLESKPVAEEPEPVKEEYPKGFLEWLLAVWR